MPLVNKLEPIQFTIVCCFFKFLPIHKKEADFFLLSPLIHYLMVQDSNNLH